MVLIIIPAYIHLRDGKLDTGKMVQCKCGAKLILYVPADKDDRRVIVIPEPEPHNHPSFPSDKFTLEAQAKLKTTIHQVGKTGLSVSRLQNSELPVVSKHGNILIGFVLFTLSPDHWYNGRR
jgi:hypothetical protein